MMGNYHVRFGKGVDNYTLHNTKFNAKSVSILVHYNSIITAHAILMSAPMYPIRREL